MNDDAQIDNLKKKLIKYLSILSILSILLVQ
jgi:hypothetical protein